MKRESRRTSKYLLLALILIAVFVLPGCRTRLTNNSEVSNVQYDEDGYMSDMYQMRRDELGLTTAERPILPDLGSGQSDENDDFSEGEEINYNPEDYQEDFSEPQTNTNTNTNTNTGNRHTTPHNSGVRQRTHSGSRRDDSDGGYKVTFNPTSEGNVGTIEGRSKPGEKWDITVEEGKTIEAPNAKCEGKKLVEWEGNNGTVAKPKEKITIKESITFTARWETDSSGGGKTDEKTFTIELELDGGTGQTSINATEGKTYGSLNIKEPTKEGSDFSAWYKDQELKKPIKDTDKVDPKITKLYAKWIINQYKTWTKKYSEEMAGEAPKITYVVADGSELDGLLNGYSGPRPEKRDYDYVVIMTDDPNNSQDEANKAIEDTAHAGTSTKVIVIKKGSLKGSDKQKLLNKIAMFNEIYEMSEDYSLSKAESDLNAKHTIAYKIYDYVEPEPEPEPDPTPDPDPESQTEP